MPNRPIVWLHPDAPPKPPEGEPCNGCGLCCLAEPCPLGMWLSRRRTGACAALRWSDAARSYRCGVLMDTAMATGWSWPPAQRLLQALARRWIAAGVGCDARVVATPAAEEHDSQL